MDILEYIEKNNSNIFENFNNFADEFFKLKKEENRLEFEKMLQLIINKIENGVKGCVKIVSKSYYTMFGKINLKMRCYKIDGKFVYLAAEKLKLPKDKWLSKPKELLCTLGVTSEFSNANKIFEEVTGIKISDRCFADKVEETGKKMYEELDSEEFEEVNLTDSVLTSEVRRNRIKPRYYLEVDGTMLALKKGIYKEAKVGVIFSESEHFSLSEKRNYIRDKEYVATMSSRKKFVDLLYSSYCKKVGNSEHELVILGDGAKWIWSMADYLYPNAIQILDFYHVSEYVWKVAREAFPDNEKLQKEWVNIQLEHLRNSESEKLDLDKFNINSDELKKAIKNLKTYLKNNKNRIDYKSYIERGLMIGSGVIESSNKKVVGQRLKQSGMFWSKEGANSVMTLRACLLSSSKNWENFWKRNVA
jgi:hypothetical protein